MEKDLQKYYINAIDNILEEKLPITKEEYKYAYKVVYSRKYNGLGNFATAIENSINKKMAKHANIPELFESNVFSDNEKQKLINYWVCAAFANAANKKKDRKETLFLNAVNKTYNEADSVLASKQYVDKHGVTYNGSDIFGQFNKEVEERGALSEFSLAAVGKIALSVGVWLGLDALSPTVAKQVPGICSLVRECAEKYPVATKIFNYTISPFDVDAFVEQDKINKGEIVEGEETDEAGETPEEDDDDDFDVVMEDGSVYDDFEDEVLLDTESENVGKIYHGTFTDDDGTVYNYTFEDRDKK